VINNRIAANSEVEAEQAALQRWRVEQQAIAEASANKPKPLWWLSPTDEADEQAAPQP